MSFAAEICEKCGKFVIEPKELTRIKEGLKEINEHLTEARATSRFFATQSESTIKKCCLCK
jgi:hypothetical protein